MKTSPGEGTRARFWPAARVWVVEDDPQVRRMVAFLMTEEGYEVWEMASATEVARALDEDPPDLIILDLGFPDGDGLEILRDIRARPGGAEIVVIILTGSRDTANLLRCFSLGADDFLVKPVDSFELVLRVRCRLERCRALLAEGADRLRVGRLVLHLSTREFSAGGRQALLTPTEFALVRYLAERADLPVPTSALLEEVLGYPKGSGSPDAVRVLVRKIRQKIEPDPSRPRVLVRAAGGGYRLVARSADPPEPPMPSSSPPRP